MPLVDPLVGGLLSQSLGDWALAAATALPCVALLPMLGLNKLPFGVRVIFSFVLATTVTPSLVIPGSYTNHSAQWMRYFLNGIPVALTASASTWAAVMTGSFIHGVATNDSDSRLHTKSLPSASLGTLFSLAAVVGFLQLGGPGRLATALQVATWPLPYDSAGVSASAFLILPLVRGISVAIAVVAPIIAVQLLTTLFASVFSRVSRQSSISPFQSLASLLHLIVAALLLDRIVEQLLLNMTRDF